MREPVRTLVMEHYTGLAHMPVKVRSKAQGLTRTLVVMGPCRGPELVQSTGRAHIRVKVRGLCSWD